VTTGPAREFVNSNRRRQDRRDLYWPGLRFEQERALLWPYALAADAELDQERASRVRAGSIRERGQI
jgi:hypothetical protein